MFLTYNPIRGFRAFYDLNADRLWFVLALFVCLVAAGQIAETIAELPVVPGSFTI